MLVYIWDVLFNIAQGEKTLSDLENSQKINKGCMILIMSPFIFIALVLGFALFMTLYYGFFPKKNSYRVTTFSNAPEYSSQLMNPIRRPRPTQFQVESTGFKTVRMVSYGGTANSTPYLFITDSNNYCYWIHGSTNELHPFFIHSKTKREEPYQNLVGNQDWPQIEYMLVTVGENSSNWFKKAKSIDMQRQWLTNNTANKNTVSGKVCENAPLADIIKIRYRLNNKVYSYEILPQQMEIFNQSLRYRFN